MHFGDRLATSGDAETLEFTHFVFKAATEGLLSAQSHGFIQDRIRVALATHFANEERQLLRLALDHAGLIFEIASLVRDGLHGDGRGPTSAPGAPGVTSTMRINWFRRRGPRSAPSRLRSFPIPVGSSGRRRGRSGRRGLLSRSGRARRQADGLVAEPG